MSEAGVVIRLRGVSFTYEDASTPALRDVNLEVERGQFVVVMGATGAGKTTLAKLLNRTIPTFQAGRLSGVIEILGGAVEHQRVADVAAAVGLVSQDFEAQLFATNVAQEVAFSMEQRGLSRDVMVQRLGEALAAVGLRGFEHRDPATLSGGEKQRLAVAAVLALRPQILVFDEPTTDLDPEGKAHIFDVLGALRGEGVTIVLIEHEIEAAEHADRLVLMRDGGIAADDHPDRLLPEVERLMELGVRAPDLDRLDRALGNPRRTRSIEEAERLVRSRFRTRSASPPVRVEPGEVVLGVEAISYAYARDRDTLSEVSLSVGAGEFVALVGQNGSGKTTLAKHLNGLLHPTRGRVRLSGRDVRDLPLNQVAADVGYVFQDPDHQIFAATVREEVEFGLRNFAVAEPEIERRLHAALEAVGLLGLEEADPFLLGKGQRQRLAVASLLALEPRVLILDEPTTGLDYLEQRRMMDLLRRLHQRGMTLVVITHSPWVVAEYAERGILLRDGRVVFDGPLRDLFSREELLTRCHFHVPDITRLGLRLGFTPLTLEEFLAALEPEPSSVRPFPLPGTATGEGEGGGDPRR